jgi:hypothetical protein
VNVHQPLRPEVLSAHSDYATEEKYHAIAENSALFLQPDTPYTRQCLHPSALFPGGFSTGAHGTHFFLQ